MDDPWGSPWATDDSQLKLDLPAPPPRIHTPQTPNKVASPWAADDDDDAWGGWNAAGNNGGAESPGWGRSPGLRPTRSGTMSRHMSPEPWGRLGISGSKSEADEERKSEKDVPATVDSAISLGEQPFARGPKSEITDIEPAPEPGLVGGNLHSAPVPEPLNTNESIPQEEEEEEDYHVRPGSPIAQPSPAITTTDRPEPTRQASKVQKLVHMYDGIAKRKHSPADPLVPGPRITLVGADEATEEADEESPQKETAPAMSSSLESPTNENSEENEGDKLPSGGVATEEARSSNHNDSSAPIHGLSTDAKPPSKPYAFDLAHLDELFPSTPVPETDPEPVPDVIIDDTFASISERKAWYRISRSGPMRQHNLGNDEDYVRLDWRRSEIRGRTLRIVRRWMEEDSIGGRVVLGRRTGPVGASMFNWDSQAPQVEIGQLLGKKEHQRSASGASKGSRSSLASPSSATFAWSAAPDATETKPQASLDAPKRNSWFAPPPSLTSPAAPSFGWSTSPQEPAEPISKAPAPETSLPARKSPPPIPAPPKQPLQSMDSIMTNGANKAPTQSASIEEEDDEDEWGEMVSSPTWPAEVSTKGQEGPLAATDLMVKVDSDPPAAHSLAQSAGFGGIAPSTWAASPTAAKSSTMNEAWNLERPVSPASTPGPAVPPPHRGSNLKPSHDVLDIWSTSDATEPGPGSWPESPKAAPSIKSAVAANSVEDATVERILSNLPDLSYMLR